MDATATPFHTVMNSGIRPHQLHRDFQRLVLRKRSRCQHQHHWLRPINDPHRIEFGPIKESGGRREADGWRITSKGPATNGEYGAQLTISIGAVGARIYRWSRETWHSVSNFPEERRDVRC